MKNILITLLLIVSLLSWQAFSTTSPTLPETTVSFLQGEHLTYQIHYGLLDAGLVNMVVCKELYTINDHPCYKVDVAGESKGLLYFWLKLKNHWVSYIDVKQLVPQLPYIDKHEGTYRKNEKYIFDHIQKQVQVEDLSNSDPAVVKQQVFNIQDNVQDILSYLYVKLRNFDFSQARTGDILHSPVFFDNILHERFSTKFLGRTKIKTKLGYIKAIVLAPLVPLSSKSNSIFANENSIEVFLSDDKNRVPLKAKLKLILGAVEMDLIKYTGTKSPLSVTK